MKKTNTIINKEAKYMRRVIVLAVMVTIALSLMAGLALATDPTVGRPHTFIESAPEAGSGIATSDNLGRVRDEYEYGGFGSSLWTYQDSYDGLNPGGVNDYKTEGSYRGFNNNDNGIGMYELSPNATDAIVGLPLIPHGGYSTSSNKCKVCHAVHRAEGAFKLMRSDSAEDACIYCHIGDHKHTDVGAYTASGGDIHTANGHTIGAGKEIPDSSTWMWSENSTLTGGDAAETGGIGYSQALTIRRYNTTRNKMMVITTENSTYHQKQDRWGPTLLTCLSCHQPHNASELVWKPTDAPNGYKLLRSSPSGSVKNKVAMEARTPKNFRSSRLYKDAYVGDTTVAVASTNADMVGNEVIIGAPLNPTNYLTGLTIAPTTTTQSRTIIAQTAATQTPAGTRGYVTLDAPLTGAAGSVPGQLLYYGQSWQTPTNAPYVIGTAPTQNDIAIVKGDGAIKVPNAELSKATTGRDNETNIVPATTDKIRSIYTTWKGGIDAVDSTITIDSASLTVWCADCHNLNIAGTQAAASNFRGGTWGIMHTDRSHPSGTWRTQCYNCHRSDLPTSAVPEFLYATTTLTASLSQGDTTFSPFAGGIGNAACAKCHFGPLAYKQVRGISDFPHSGNASSTKLLKDGVGVTYVGGGAVPLTGDAAYDASSEHIDSICLDCHNLIGGRM